MYSPQSTMAQLNMMIIPLRVMASKVSIKRPNIAIIVVCRLQQQDLYGAVVKTVISVFATTAALENDY